MTIPTVSTLQRSRRRLDRRRHGANRVLAAMRAGETLSLSYERGGPMWRLSSGTIVAANVAALVITHASVISAGDALFQNMAGQSWRWDTP